MENKTPDALELQTEELIESELETENETEETVDAVAEKEPEYEPKNKFEKCLYKVYKDENLGDAMHSEAKMFLEHSGIEVVQNPDLEF